MSSPTSGTVLSILESISSSFSSLFPFFICLFIFFLFFLFVILTWKVVRRGIQGDGMDKMYVASYRLEFRSLKLDCGCETGYEKVNIQM